MVQWGQKQRSMLACARLQNLPILILGKSGSLLHFAFSYFVLFLVDEAMSPLDPPTRILILYKISYMYSREGVVDRGFRFQGD